MNANSSGGNENRSIFAHSEFWTGLILLIFGLVAAWMASDFDDSSRPYPLTLGLIMAVLGMTIMVRAFSNKNTHVSFVLPSKVALAAGSIIVIWIVLIATGFGYLLPTFLMQLAFLLVCGFRRLVRAAMVAALISIVSYLVFIVGLGVRLPEPLFPWLF